MILYKDKQIKKIEDAGKWFHSIKYLSDKWNSEKDNVSLFLKLSTNTWYTLTLDGPELSLTETERSVLAETLCQCFLYFDSTFSQDDTCQWIFGYMMEVRPDLFLKSGVDYDNIEKTGKCLIHSSCESGNIIAKLLDEAESGVTEKNPRYYEDINISLNEYFDSSWEVDRYFIEILTMKVHSRKRLRKSFITLRKGIPPYSC